MKMFDHTAIRTIHHLAGSGGTVMSKALAAQPAVAVISEVSPVVGDIRFNPYDPVQQFIANYARRNSDFIGGKSSDVFAREVFAARLSFVHKACTMTGRYLVVRDHAHSNFMQVQRQKKSALLVSLEEAGIPTRSLLTLRDPVDTWLNYIREGWDKSLDGFQDFCERTEHIVSLFPKENIVLYETFCSEPEVVTEEMCRILQIPYEEGFEAKLSGIKLTGDSGRSSNKVELRPRRPVSDAVAAEINASEAYSRLKQRFWPESPDVEGSSDAEVVPDKV